MTSNAIAHARAWDDKQNCTDRAVFLTWRVAVAAWEEKEVGRLLRRADRLRGTRGCSVMAFRHWYIA